MTGRQRADISVSHKEHIKHKQTINVETLVSLRKTLKVNYRKRNAERFASRLTNKSSTDNVDRLIYSVNSKTENDASQRANRCDSEVLKMYLLENDAYRKQTNDRSDF